MTVRTTHLRLWSKRNLLLLFFVVATIQLAWCYLWLTRPYVNTRLYELGLERMPFQGRCLMLLPMRAAHSRALFDFTRASFGVSHFWFPRPVQPEVIVQAGVNVICLLLAGFFTTRVYQASSRYRLFTPLIYPLFLVAFAVTYILHTVQNFRFIYDLPSLAFFAGAMYLIYFRRHIFWFVALFLVATVNRETTLLLLPLYMIDKTITHKGIVWKKAVQWQTLRVVVPLLLAWFGWLLFVRYHFHQNPSEFYPRFDWNLKSLIAPQAWPQMLSACGFLLPLVIIMRARISDTRLRMWLWILPVWIVFMFSYGILIETRVFGELIPLLVCAAASILENSFVNRLRGTQAIAAVSDEPPHLYPIREAA